MSQNSIAETFPFFATYRMKLDFQGMWPQKQSLTLDQVLCPTGGYSLPLSLQTLVTL
jgi:hypothetical protein